MLIVMLAGCNALGLGNPWDGDSFTWDSDTADSDADTDTDTDADTDRPDCDAVRFGAAASEYTLPLQGDGSDTVSFSGLAGSDSYSCADGTGSGTASWTVSDLSGDGALDLVVFDDSCDPLNPLTQWLFYSGARGGFDSTGSAWTLPIIGSGADSASLRGMAGSDSFSCAEGGSGVLRWQVQEMTGDSDPDLLVTDNGCDALVPLTQWQVYPAQGQAFASEPDTWTVPILGDATNPALLTSTAGSTSYTCAAGGVATMIWATGDLDQDGQLDLVITSDGCDTLVPLTQWRVHFGTPNGFGETPESWSLPLLGDSSSTVQFTSLTGSDSFTCSGGGSGTISWTVTDISGDDLVDLVVMNDSCDATVPLVAWNVYLGSETGFDSTPTAFNLPVIGDATDPALFSGLAGSDSYTCAGGSSGSLTWSVSDLTSDGLLDLTIHNDTCDALVPLVKWRTHAGTGTGFAAAADWTLPLHGNGADTALFGSSTGADSYACASTGTGTVQWTTSDLTGDGLQDLVIHNDTCDALIPLIKWSVYPGECAE